MTTASTLLTLGSARKTSCETCIWSAPCTLHDVLSHGLLHTLYVYARIFGMHSFIRQLGNTCSPPLKFTTVSSNTSPFQRATHMSAAYKPNIMCHWHPRSKVCLLLCRHCCCAVQTDRYAEYPKLKELVERKDALIAARATPPTFLKVRMLFSTAVCPPSWALMAC